MTVTAGLDTTEAFAPIDGALYSAATTTALPTGTAALPTGWIGHGYWTSDGLTENASTSTNSVRAFQGNTLIAKTVTDGEATFQLTLLQTKDVDNAELYFAATATQTATEGTLDWDPATAAGERHFVIDKINGTEIERHAFKGEITARGSRVTTYGGVPGYPITITAYGEVTVINTAWKS